jgi:hypothetical protein
MDPPRLKRVIRLSNELDLAARSMGKEPGAPASGSGTPGSLIAPCATVPGSRSWVHC